MGRIDLDFDRIRHQSGQRSTRSHHRGGVGALGPLWNFLEGLGEMAIMAEWIKVGLPVLAAILSAYVMIQGHDIKINRLESDMKSHTLEHKQEAKENSEKLSRIEIAVERIETKLEAARGR
jgi:hypothetical protein